MVHSVCITGASGKIGQLLIKHFIDAGIRFIDIQKRQTSCLLNDDITSFAQANGCKIAEHHVDLANEDDVYSFASNVFKPTEASQLLVNCAASFEASDALDSDISKLKETLQINSYAPFILTQELYKQSEGRAKVIHFLDSYISKNKTPFFNYLLSKKMLGEMIKMLSVQFSPMPINAISPGILDISKEQISDELYLKKTNELPLRALPKADDIIKAIDFLVSVDSITGQVINIDGGEHLL